MEPLASDFARMLADSGHGIGEAMAEQRAAEQRGYRYRGLWAAGLLALGATGGIALSAIAGEVRYTLDNAANTFSMDKIEKTKAGYVYWFFDKHFARGKTLKLSVVRAGEASHAPHSHPEDEFFFVLSGKAEFRLDGKTRVVGARTGMYAPPNVEHGIRNVGDTELEYLVIKEYQDIEKAPDSTPGKPVTVKP